MKTPTIKLKLNGWSLSSFKKKKKKIVKKLKWKCVDPYCFQKFSTEEKLDKHIIDCIIHTYASVRVEFTKKKIWNSPIIKNN